MQSLLTKIVRVLKRGATAVIGIMAEIALVAFFIAVGFFICFIWWRIGR